MGVNSKIEWCDHTANLWQGCTKVLNNPLCDNCYANTLANRMGKDGAVVSNIQRKEQQAEEMFAEIVKNMTPHADISRLAGCTVV